MLVSCTPDGFGALTKRLSNTACLALNPGFWAVSQVSEMYSLWVLSAVALTALAARLSRDPSERLWPAFYQRLVTASMRLAARFAPKAKAVEVTE